MDVKCNKDDQEYAHIHTRESESDEENDIDALKPREITECTPTCPVIAFEQRNSNDTSNQIRMMPCQQLHVSVECFISTAIISIEGKWTNQTNDALDATFVLPTPGTVVSFTVHTAPQSEAGDVTTKTETNTRDCDIAQTPNLNLTPKQPHPDEPYNAGFFRFPGMKVDPVSTISVKCQYFETLDTHEEGYIVSLPLSFPPGTIRETANEDEVVTIECKLNGLPADTKIDCLTHHVKIASPDDETSIHVTSDMTHCKPLEEEKKREDEAVHVVLEGTGRDFELAYEVDTSTTQMHCIRTVDS
eukprot:94246_1